MRSRANILAFCSVHGDDADERCGKVVVRALCAALCVTLSSPAFSNDPQRLLDRIATLQSERPAAVKQLDSSRLEISSAYVSYVDSTGGLPQPHHGAFVLASTRDHRPQTSHTLLKLADSGCIPCMGAVAERMYEGQLPSPNPGSAVEWASRGSNAGDGRSSYVMGRAWRDQRVARTTARALASPPNRGALSYFLSAGGQGYVLGTLHAAQMLMHGVPDVPREPSRAHFLLVQAAKTTTDPDMKKQLQTYIAAIEKAMDEEERVARESREAERREKVAKDPGMVFLAAFAAAIAYGRSRPDAPLSVPNVESSLERWQQNQKDIEHFNDMVTGKKPF